MRKNNFAEMDLDQIFAEIEELERTGKNQHRLAQLLQFVEEKFVMDHMPSVERHEAPITAAH